MHLHHWQSDLELFLLPRRNCKHYLTTTNINKKDLDYLNNKEGKKNNLNYVQWYFILDEVRYQGEKWPCHNKEGGKLNFIGHRDIQYIIYLLLHMWPACYCLGPKPSLSHVGHANRNNNHTNVTKSMVWMSVIKCHEFIGEGYEYPSTLYQASLSATKLRFQVFQNDHARQLII